MASTTTRRSDPPSFSLKLNTVALSPQAINAIMGVAPKAMLKPFKEILADSQMNGHAMALMSRASEFSSPMAAMLAGVAMNSAAREHLLDAIASRMQPMRPYPTRGANIPVVEELVIGGGYHAAVYCAARVAAGFPCPSVVAINLGGVFGMTRKPSFFLNSRNRPGPLGLPGDIRSSLNGFPGAPVQPSDFGTSEYQTNADVAFVTQAIFGMLDAPLYEGNVEEIGRTNIGGNYAYRALGKVEDGKRKALFAKRIIVATGLNAQASAFKLSDRVLNFRQFMQRFDDPFPLRGMGRVAVIGAGDSGKNVIEALTGQGPGGHLSATALDYPSKIDWYGTNASCIYASDWGRDSRSRYKAIGRLLPDINGTSRPSRVTPIPRSAGMVTQGFKCAYVDEVPYDYVISCTGATVKTPALDIGSEVTDFVGDKRPIAMRAQQRPVYYVGPAAFLPWNAQEVNAPYAVPSASENLVSMFRYAPRTAALASYLDDPSPRD